MQVNDGTARGELAVASSEIIEKLRKEKKCLSQAVEIQRQLMRSDMIDSEAKDKAFEEQQEKLELLKTSNQGYEAQVKQLHHSKQSIKRQMTRLTDQLDKRPVGGGNGPLEYGAVDLASVSAKEASEILQQACLGRTTR